MGFFQEFKKFALRGNVVSLAVGFTVGAAFTTVVKSLVDDVLMPPVGLVLGRSDFSDLFLVLEEGPNAPPPYATLAEAQAAGSVTINYGVFVNNLVAFLIVAFAVFLIVRTINRIEDEMEEYLGADRKPPEEPENKKCPYCRSVIPHRALRCPACTSHLTEEPATASATGAT